MKINPKAPPIIIRPEKLNDYDAIRGVITHAFDQKNGEGAETAAHADAIRSSRQYLPQYSLVAQDMAGQVVGYVMLSYVTLQNKEVSYQVLTLSPLAVDPSSQGVGIGGQLIKEAVSLADKAGEPLIVLEGSSHYYSRFGFDYSVPHGIIINLPDWAPKESAMIRRLSNYSNSLRGTIVYPPHFH